MPTLTGLAWLTDRQKASIVWPESVRPLRSVIVSERMTGRRRPISAKTRSIATIAAFMLSVSKLVSGSRMSTPPSIRPRVCSA